MEESSTIRFSLVIPAYNEEEAVEGTLRSVSDRLSSYPADDYEILFVDDGSTDKTVEKAESFPGVKVIRLPRNLGYGAAIKAGVRSSRFDWVMIMDSDGQHSLEFLDGFLEAARQGYVMAVGARKEGSHKQWFREPGKWLLRFFANMLADVKIPDLNSGMRLFKKSIFYKYEPLYPNGFSISTSMTLAFIGDGYPVKFVPIKALKRVGRQSNVRMLRDGFNTLVTIVRTISLFNPLRIFIPASLFTLTVGFTHALLNVLEYGRISNTSIVFSVASVLLFLFGVLADQIALLRRQHGNSLGNQR